MNKPRVIFPFVEAGLGHIMAEKSIADAFEEKYGDLCEVVRVDFYKQTSSNEMLSFEKRMCNEVKLYNKFNIYGYLVIAAMNFFGGRVCSWYVLKKLNGKAYKQSVEFMTKLQPDVVVSTHWATNYIAYNIENRPLTAMYGPDAHLNAMFRYDCDLDMISIPKGYRRALKCFPKRFNKDNLKLVPTAIRKEAFEVERDKNALRNRLGLDDKFTLLIMEGGYGIGMMEKLCNRLIDEDLPVNLIAIAGNNEELAEKLRELKSKGRLTFYPMGFCKNILEYTAVSDLYLGKSGSGILEPAFFGVPIVVTHSANTIEKRIADHYVKEVGCATKIFKVENCIQFIKQAIAGSEEYLRMKNARENLQAFGGEGIADEIFAMINEKYKLK